MFVRGAQRPCLSCLPSFREVADNGAETIALPQKSDTEVIRDAVTREVTNDAYAISGQIFKGQEPDVSRVSNDQLDARYRQAFVTNDRNYLMAEAARDPVQFLASMQRLGVQMPPGQEIESQPKLPTAAKPNVPLPKPPAQALPTPVDPNAPVTPPPQVAPPAPVPAPAAPTLVSGTLAPMTAQPAPPPAPMPPY